MSKNKVEPWYPVYTHEAYDPVDAYSTNKEKKMSIVLALHFKRKENRDLFPAYQSLKIVNGFKIANIVQSKGCYHLVPVDWDGEPRAIVEVDNLWVAKHEPLIGGWFVIYEDGYYSYCPDMSFSKGSDLLTGRRFFSVSIPDGETHPEALVKAALDKFLYPEEHNDVD